MVDTPRVLFARIGWMRFYRSIRPDNEPIGGGSYNEENTGSEVANFFPWQGRVYGFFRTPLGSRLNFRRIGRNARDAEALEGVLLIFIGRRAEGGQVVVGWAIDRFVERGLRTANVQVKAIRLIRNGGWPIGRL